MKLSLKFAAGPFGFLLLFFLPYPAPSPQARLALAAFGWMILWWMTQPVPWAIASLLPLVLFPVLGIATIDKTVGLYGQTIFFWIWGTILMGYAMDRHGLAKRFALWFLSLPVIRRSTLRLVFGFMLVTALISTVISDAATVAMMIPVGISLVSFVRSIQGTPPGTKSNFGAFVSLGTLYGAAAGGTATIAGLPHNGLSLALLEKFTGRALGWFEWMKAGIPIFLLCLLAFFLILRLFLPLEMNRIPGGEKFLQDERRKLGSWTSGQRATLVIFLVMVVLLILPTLLGFALGPNHPLTQWSNTGLALNVVPPIVLLLLFCTPVNWAQGEFVLTWKETVAHSPWNILFMATSATAVVGMLVELGFAQLGGDLLAGWGLGRHSLPFAAAALVAFGTNFMPGAAATSLFGSLLIPAAQQVGWNPTSMAILIPNVALGIALPWAGAAAATVFAAGQIEMKEMMRIGIIATLVFAFLVAGIHILLAPVL